MLKTAYTHGQLAAFERFGVSPEIARGLAKHADLVEQVAAAERALPAKAPAAQGWFQKLRNAKVPLGIGLGIGGLVGGGMVLNDLRRTPEMQVTPSAPIAPLMP